MRNIIKFIIFSVFYCNGGFLKSADLPFPSYFDSTNKIELISCNSNIKKLSMILESIGYLQNGNPDPVIINAIFKVKDRPTYIICRKLVSLADISKSRALETHSFYLFLDSKITPEQVIKNPNIFPFTQAIVVSSEDYAFINDDEIVNKYFEWSNKAQSIKPDSFSKVIPKNAKYHNNFPTQLIKGAVFEWNGNNSCLKLVRKGDTWEINSDYLKMFRSCIETLNIQGNLQIENYIDDFFKKNKNEQDSINSNFK